MNEQVKDDSSENNIIRERRKKLNQLRETTLAYPNKLSPKNRAKFLHQEYSYTGIDRLYQQGTKA